jgi:Fe-S cluster assembly protein SufD
VSTTIAAPALLEQATAAAAAEAPDVLRALRAAGAREFESLGLPTTKVEDWHYTSVSSIADASFVPMTGDSTGVSAETLAPYVFSAAWPTLVFVNGVYSAVLSNTDSLPAGIRVLPLAAAVTELGDLITRHLGTLAPPTRDGFTALNTSFLGEGVVMHVAKEMVIDVPVHVLFVTTDAGAGGMQHPRMLVVAERHAKATLVESWIGLTEAPYFSNAVAEVVVEDGATLHHLKVQREGVQASHVGTIEAHQGRDSHYVSFAFATGARLSRTNIYTVLDGEGCGTTLNGLTMLDGTQHGDVQTRIEHAQPNCFSRQIYKSVLDDTSHGVFNGKVYVQSIAQQTDGKQTNNTLLLSKTAQVDAKPQLEIFADDVRCTHGATVGQIDQTSLFYMKSRGIDAEMARQLLTYAFAAEVVETLENDTIREQLERVTMRRFTSAVD